MHDAFSFIESSGGIDGFRLDANDLQVLFLEDTAAPVVTFMVTYHVGSRNEHAGHTGATHMLEHLMFKGTERFHKRRGTSIFDTLQRVGAEVNASTWVDRTNYYEMLPKEHLPLAIEIEADRMRNALLDPDDVEAERTVILNEYDQGQNEPTRRLFDAVWSAAFVAHPYHHPTIGWRSDIETISRDGLKHFYDTYYWPNNATLSIIGDVDRDAALAQVAEAFGDLPRAPHAIPEVTTREPEQAGPRHVTVHQDGQLGAVLMGYKSPPALDEASDALDVLARILASGKSSRLYRRLTDRGLAADVFAMNFRLRDPSLFSLFAFLNPERTHEEVQAAIEETLAAVRADGVTADEVARAKKQLIAKEAFGRDGSFQVAAQLNEAIAAGDWRLYTTYLDRIDAVTVDAVNAAAQRFLTPAGRTTGWYVPDAVAA
ncbi:M16 family metallopeptidase [Salisaeta longa]|uniref:M16 family metallopeptidase n=1 Tax=Salisaeta longa TaxID=503170 RepID=UPI0003B6CDEF|nr:pitrilysin family protein [Salisaeta longa]